MEAGGITERVTLRRLLGTRSFVVPYIAETQSILGDQLARFALSVLVYDRTNSAAAAAITYALTFIPAILGGFVLGGLGDRYEHGRVMIAADLLRAAMFVVMAIPHMPIGVLIAVLSVAVFFGPAYSSAEVGFLSLALDTAAFRTSVGFRSASNQFAQVIGFAVAGAVVVWLEPRGALLVNAATFAVSALVVSLGLPESVRGPRRRGATPASADPRAASDLVFAGLWSVPRTRPLMVLTVLMGLFVLPEGLGVPFGQHIGASTTQTGVLLAAIPCGSAIGAMVIHRVRGANRDRVAGTLASLCGLPLLASVFDPSWEVATLCWFVSGLFAAYFVEVIPLLVEAIPEPVRSAQMGIVGAWLLGAQGAAFACGGWLSSAVGLGAAIAIPAGVGCVVAVVQLWVTRVVE